MSRRKAQLALAAVAFLAAAREVAAFAPPQSSSPLSVLPTPFKVGPTAPRIGTSAVVESRLRSAVDNDLSSPVVADGDGAVVAPPAKKSRPTFKRRLQNSADAAFRSIFVMRQRMQLAVSNSSTPSSAKLREYLFVILAGLCLSFNSGYINGCCLSGLLSTSGRAVGVTAFTGGYTKAGLALGAGQFGDFGFQVSMILTFMFGSCLSGMINPRPVERQLGPTYGPSFLLGSALLATASVLSNVRPEGRALFYFAAAANGLQNGMSSMYSANLVRSTHMTGITTDIGMIIGQMLRGNTDSAWKALALIGFAASFGLGGAASYHAVTKFRSLALVFNATLFAAIGSACIGFTAMQQHVPLWWAATGHWQWKDGEAPSSDVLLKLFDQVDADGKGCIDKKGLRFVLYEAGMRVSSSSIKAIFRIVDTDGDGFISKEEMLAVVDCDPEGQCLGIG